MLEHIKPSTDFAKEKIKTNLYIWCQFLTCLGLWSSGCAQWGEEKLRSSALRTLPTAKSLSARGEMDSWRKLMSFQCYVIVKLLLLFSPAEDGFMSMLATSKFTSPSLFIFIACHKFNYMYLFIFPFLWMIDL